MDCDGSTYGHQLLSLHVEHAQIEVDELQVGRGRGVVSAPQLRVETLSHVSDTDMYLHAHG